MRTHASNSSSVLLIHFSSAYCLASCLENWFKKMAAMIRFSSRYSVNILSFCSFLLNLCYWNIWSRNVVCNKLNKIQTSFLVCWLLRSVIFFLISNLLLVFCEMKTFSLSCVILQLHLFTMFSLLVYIKCASQYDWDADKKANTES